MALTFPDPNLEPEYIAPNGITYIWDDTDEKWRVKAFRSQDDVLVIVGDTPPDDPKKGDLWWDNEPDSLTLFVYEGSAWVPAAPPVSLDGINATIDAALLVQEDLVARVSLGETLQEDIQTVVENALITQDEIEADIDVLENKVEALEGTIVDGRWTLDNRSVAREGHFIPFTGVTASVAWAGTDTLQIHPTDLDGNSYTFVDVSIGDVIRIGSVGSSASFKCLGNAQLSGDVYNISVELLNSSGAPFESLTYDFEFLDAFDPSAYATKQYVDAQDELNVKKTGDSMTGDLSFDGASLAVRILNGGKLRYTAADPDGNQRTFIDIQHSDNSGAEGTDAGYRMKLYHLQEPTSPQQAATKNYIDTKFVKNDGDTYSSYLDFEAQGGGARFFRGTDKYFSIWSFQIDETRCRIDPGRNFKLTGYRDGDSTEQQLLWWDQANDAFHISRVADPTRDDHGMSRGYADGRYVEQTGSTMTGHLQVTQPGAATGTYLFSVEAPHLEAGKQVAFRVTGDGKVKAGHDTTHYFQASQANDVVTKGYLDDQLASGGLTGDYLPLTGGTLIGTLTGQLIKSIRNTGYAFEVKPDNTGDAVAFIHTNGDLKAKKIKIEGNISGSNRPFEIEGRLSDGSTVSKDFFYMYANNDGTASAMNYKGKMDSEHNLTNVGYVNNKVGNGEFYQSGGALYFNTAP